MTLQLPLQFAVFAAITTACCWDNIPSIPSNRRSQYYLRNDDGAYNYGYDSGDGLAAQQQSTADNQVEGFYTSTNPDGSIVNVKYTAGVQGFVPETSQPSGAAQSRNVQSSSWNSQSHQAVKPLHAPVQAPARSFSTPHVPTRTSSSSIAQHDEDSNSNSDASYKISYNTGEHSRDEKSDAAGNVQGRYSYTDEAGEHDLTYVAGPGIGFQVTGGSLSSPNGLANVAAASRASKTNFQSKVASNSRVIGKSWKTSPEPSADGAYAFSYDAGDHSRTESADSSGNVQGRYSYSDEAGQHDLSYVAGADTGFVVTGGSLSNPSGATASRSFNQGSQSNLKSNANLHSRVAEKSWASPDVRSQQPATDGAYSFSYDADDHSRTETADSAGNIQGRYSFSNEAGQHDLSYIAGADTGFVVTGGSLADPNGLAAASPLAAKAIVVAPQQSWRKPPNSGTSADFRGSNQQQSSANLHSHGAAVSSKVFNQQPTTSDHDGSAYAFSYQTDSHSRQESSDATGRVKGGFEVKTDGGHQQFQFETGGRGSDETQNDFKQGWQQQQGPKVQQQGWEDQKQSLKVHSQDWQQPQKDLKVQQLSWEDQLRVQQQDWDNQQQGWQQQQQGWQDQSQDFDPDQDLQFGGGFNPFLIPSTHRMRIFNNDDSVYPSFTVITPSSQKSLDYGPKDAVILNYLPPQHSKKHGYIYDTQH